MGGGLGEGGIIFFSPPWTDFATPTPTLPIKGEGVLAIFNAILKLGMMFLGAKAISVKNFIASKFLPGRHNPNF
jgi:hypothetical protein